jgi:hypothetical protein
MLTSSCRAAHCRRLAFACLGLLTQDLLAQSTNDAKRRALEAALAQPGAAPASPLPQASDQKSQIRLVDVSLDVLFSVGSSTARDDVLSDLQGGGHDPRKRGFTLQQAELSLIGAVDPWFEAETHLVYFIDPYSGESQFEVEEAFLHTTSLPAGFDLEVGQFFTEFGRINPKHPHAWDWQDQPFVLTRFFGGDGLRGAGARLGWLAPVPWLCELHAGVQNANGETMTSFLANDEVFEERPIGGRPFVERDVRSLDDFVWLARLDNAFEPSGDTTLSLGASALYGPNATGSSGSTWIAGADAAFTWRPRDHFRGWPFVKLRAEWLTRAYKADDFFDERDPTDPLDDVLLPSDTLRDQGFYVEGLWGFMHRWSAGMRAEWATGSGINYDEDGAAVDRNTDPYRADRWRLSPLLTFQPSEFSRIRLQYNFDDSDHLSENVHSVWLGFEVLIGAHPAHGL